MTDVSSEAPMKSAAWDAKLATNSAARCSAHRSKTGEQCRKFAIAGSTVCRTHGGAAPHVKRAARARLENAADRMARELLKMATDDNVSDAVKLAALRDVLDRAGLSAKTAIEVEVGPTKPFETILSGIAEVVSSSRADYRASVGRPDPEPHPALADDARALDAADDRAVVDAEIIDEDGDALIAAMRPRTHVTSPPHPLTYGDGERAARDDSAPGINPLTGTPLGPTGPSSGLLPLDEAVSAMAAMRRDAARRGNGQRALPPGRSSQ